MDHNGGRCDIAGDASDEDTDADNGRMHHDANDDDATDANEDEDDDDNEEDDDIDADDDDDTSQIIDLDA